MNVSAVTAAVLLFGASQAVATLPGWTPGSIAFAGDDLIATQSGPVRSKALVYFRTDAWRVPMRSAGAIGVARRVVTVRTSIGPTSVAPLVGATGGVFSLIAAGPGFAPPVIWCCDRESGLQSVIESDGSPGARVPIAIGMSGSSVRYVARDGDASVVSTVDPLTGVRVEVPVPGRPAGGRSVVSGDTLAWVDDPPYDLGQTVRRARIGSRAVTPLASFGLRGTVVSLASANGTLVALEKQNALWVVTRASSFGGPARRVWTGTTPPLVATGDGQVAIAVGRQILAGRGSVLRPVARLARPARALAVKDGRVAWLDWALVDRRKRTVVRWLVLR